MPKRKKYMLFTYDSYEAQGGEGSSRGMFDSYDEIIEYLNKNDRYDYCDVLNLDNGKWNEKEIDFTLVKNKWFIKK